MERGKSDISEPAYRWAILAAATVILAMVMGQIVNGFSVYFVPLEAAEGWARAEIAMVNTAGLLGLAVGSLLSGFVAERVGIRPVVLGGIIAAGAGWMVASRTSGLGQLYLVSFLIGMFGGGATVGPIMTLVGNWFVRGAGLALGIAAAGQATGQGVMPFTGAFLIQALGWRDALLAQGIATLVVLLPLALLMRAAPRPPGRQPLEDVSPTGLPNWMLTGWLSLAALGCCTLMAVPLMHLVPLIEGRGHAAPEASSVLFTMMLVAIAGRVAFGRLADAIGGLPTYMIASGWQTVMVLGFTFWTRLDHFYIYAVVFGFGYAGVMTAIFVTCRILSAPARRASTIGFVLAFAYIGHGLGGWQGGLFYDLTGAYTWSFVNSVFAGVFNLALLAVLWLTLRRRPPARPAAPSSAVPS